VTVHDSVLKEDLMGDWNYVQKSLTAVQLFLAQE